MAVGHDRGTDGRERVLHRGAEAVDAGSAALAHALRAERREGRWRLERTGLERWHVERVGHVVVVEVRRQQVAVLVVGERLPERGADRVRGRAHHLALDDQRVDAVAAVVDRRVLDDLVEPRLGIDLDQRGVHLRRVRQREVAELALEVGHVEVRSIDVAAVERRRVLGEARVVRVDDRAERHERERGIGVCADPSEPAGQLDVVGRALEDHRGQQLHLGCEHVGRALCGRQAGDGELARVGAREAGVRVPVAVVPGAHVDHLDRAVEDRGDDLRGRRLVALTLRRRAERDDDLAEDVELADRDLVVARELQVLVEDLRLAEVVRARVERRADPEAQQLAARGGVGAAFLEAVVADQIERQVERARVVAGVVDAAVRRLVRHLLGLDVVELADRHRVHPELARDDVDDPLGQPEVLHARVAAVRRDRGLVRHHLLVVDAHVPPAVHARHDLRPDHAAERLVAQVCTRVVERLAAKAEQRPVSLDGDLDVVEPALVAVRHRLVELGAPLGPLDGTVELAGEQAAGDELRMRGDLVAEAAADVLRDHPQLVEPDAQRGAHHDHGEAGELVVRRDRPLADAAVVLDERAIGLERGRVEAVEVQLLDLDDVVGLGEGGVEIAPLVDVGIRLVGAALVVQERRGGVGRRVRIDDRVERLVLDLDQLGGIASSLAGLGHDRGDGVADEARLADREREVAHIAPRLRGDLEERVGQKLHLVTRQRAVDAR